jgi:uncharacterized protein YjiS (DUF1127 family)
MSQIDVCDNHTLNFEASRPAKRLDPLPAMARGLDRIVTAYVARREKRRTLAILTKLSDCQLRDIGIDPAAIFGERIGTIDEVHGDRFHGL